MLREEPTPIQSEILSKLDEEQPDIHILLDIHKISTLCAKAEKRKLLRGHEDDAYRISRTRNLLANMRDAIADIGA